MKKAPTLFRIIFRRALIGSVALLTCGPAVKFTISTPITINIPGTMPDLGGLLLADPAIGVTWTATGGKITPDGVFSADKPGNYTIVATVAGRPDLFAAVPVTVTASSAP